MLGHAACQGLERAAAEQVGARRAHVLEGRVLLLRRQAHTGILRRERDRSLHDRAVQPDDDARAAGRAFQRQATGVAAERDAAGP